MVSKNSLPPRPNPLPQGERGLVRTAGTYLPLPSWERVGVRGNQTTCIYGCYTLRFSCSLIKERPRRMRQHPTEPNQRTIERIVQWLEAYLAHSFHYWEIVFSAYLVGGRSRAHFIGTYRRWGIWDACTQPRPRACLVPEGTRALQGDVVAGGGV